MEFDLLIFGVLTAGAVLIVGQVTRLARATMLHRTIRRAIREDVELSTTLLEGLNEKPARGGDDRLGLILIAIAVATALFGVIQGDAEQARSMAAVALYPGLVGAVLLARDQWLRKRGS